MITLDRAIILAAMCHEGQTDKQGNPAILHPIAVMCAVPTVEEKIVAILHDTLEDGDNDSTLSILLEFDDDTEMHFIDALGAITRAKGEAYFDYIKRVKQNPLARSVKIADLHHNMTRCCMGGPEFDSLYHRYEKALNILS